MRSLIANDSIVKTFKGVHRWALEGSWFFSLLLDVAERLTITCPKDSDRAEPKSDLIGYTSFFLHFPHSICKGVEVEHVLCSSVPSSCRGCGGCLNPAHDGKDRQRSQFASPGVVEVPPVGTPAHSPFELPDPWFSLAARW